MKDKFILDACCGGKAFWFNKNHPNTIYQDIRKEKKGFVKARPNYEVKPNIVGDFRDMKHFPSKRFKLIAFDPPHFTSGSKTCWISQKYGILDKDNWKQHLGEGFSECWRVLEDYGVLIFKWNEGSIPLKEVLEIFPEKPLFGHPTARSGKTKWVCFMKIPEVGVIE